MISEQNLETRISRLISQLCEGLEEPPIDYCFENISFRAFNVLLSNELSIKGIQKMGRTWLLAAHIRNCGTKTAKELSLWAHGFMERELMKIDTDDLISAGYVGSDTGNYKVVYCKDHKTLSVGDIVTMRDVNSNNYLVRINDLSIHDLKADGDYVLLVKETE